MRAIAQDGETYAKVCVQYEKREFHIAFGYDERESIKIRLEPLNDKVYIDYVNVDTRVWQTKELTLEEFVELIKGITSP